MKEAAEFFLTWLTPNPVTEKLVSGPSISPENSFLTGDKSFAQLDMGPAMDQQIAVELFDNCLAAGKVLGINDQFIESVIKARAQLAEGMQIGSDGRLLEWSTERPEREPGHRHLSHLYAVYPGWQINPRETPALAVAARKSLDARLKHRGTRGDGKAADSGNTGWSLAWSANLWARLGDGEKAWHTLKTLLSRITFPNLMDKCPSGTKGFVFQIDGNLGMPAAIIEMLLQSHTGEIELLPALPAEWAEGSMQGLCARGGFELDVEWAGGRLKQAVVRSEQGGRCAVRYRQRVLHLNIDAGTPVFLHSEQFDSTR
jgi:alpha-L-fucosidase 2